MFRQEDAGRDRGESLEVGKNDAGSFCPDEVQFPSGNIIHGRHAVCNTYRNLR